HQPPPLEPPERLWICRCCGQRTAHSTLDSPSAARRPAHISTAPTTTLGSSEDPEKRHPCVRTKTSPMFPVAQTLASGSIRPSCATGNMGDVLVGLFCYLCTRSVPSLRRGHQ